MEVVEAVCTTCHETNQVTRSSGYTEDGWRKLIGAMIDLSGSPKQQDRIMQYLAAHFPPNERLAPRLVHGRGRDRVQGILLKRAAWPFRSGER